MRRKAPCSLAAVSRILMLISPRSAMRVPLTQAILHAVLHVRLDFGSKAVVLPPLTRSRQLWGTWELVLAPDHPPIAPFVL
jgi:hypothetical protein